MRTQLKITRATLLLLAASLSVALAEVPRPQPVSRYSELWNNSRITSKPEPEEVVVENKLDDYVLLSVTPLGDDYMVSIRNKKDTTKGRVRIYPGETNKEGFTVKNVEQSNDYMATKVTLVHDGKVGVVEYDAKYLALKKPPAASPAQAKKGNNRNQKANNNRNARNAKPSAPNASRNNPPNPASRNDTAKQNMPPGLEAALQGNNNSGNASGNNSNNNNATNNQSTNTRTRKPRVRRVPTPPSR